MFEMMWLSPDGGDGGNGAGAAAASTGTATGQTQEGSQAAQATQTQAAQTFTQADVDRIVGERAKRAEQSAIGELLKGLGLEKAEDLKALVEAARKSESDKLSEAEKAQKKIADLQKAIEQAKAEAKTASEAANEKLLTSQVLVAAQTIGFIDPADAMLYLDRGKVKVDEAGNFTGIEEMLKEIVKAKPHLVKPQAGALGAVPSPRGKGATTPQEAEQDLQEFAAVYGLNPKYLKKG
jgi:hypothetical protein